MGLLRLHEQYAASLTGFFKGKISDKASKGKELLSFLLYARFFSWLPPVFFHGFFLRVVVALPMRSQAEHTSREALSEILKA